MSNELMITASGMCCALGYNTAASIAAIRSGLDHFRETEFHAQGKALIGAPIYGYDQWGPNRLIFMLEHALNDCLQQVEIDVDETLLLLLLPKMHSPGVKLPWLNQLVQHISKQYNIKIQPFFSGKAGIGYAIQEAQAILQSGQYKNILLAGVDSYFVAETISHYLNEERLMTASNSSGFFPGEGAGVVLLQKATSKKTGFYITGAGFAKEEAHILQKEKKLKAVGLTKAIKEAVAQQPLKLSETLFHVSDVNGEAYYFREAALAITRCLDQKIPAYPHWLMADYLGETGAASAPLILATIYNLMPRDEVLGTRGLIHFSADTGERSALIVVYRKPKEKVNG